MNILITNIWLLNFGGTEVYVRDLAKALLSLGHQIEIYSPHLGIVSRELTESGIHVTDSVDQLLLIPEIIHGHHTKPTLDVINKFPSVPVIYFLHDRLHPEDTPPVHQNIIQYVAVDYNCLDRLIHDAQIPPDQCTVIYNWVDTSRFKLRNHIADKPVKALVFSNYANKRNHYNTIKAACDETGITVRGIGNEFGNGIRFPEHILIEYDIVFAKAKAAMEALATGAAVILCDFRGLGEMVVPEKFDYYRQFNFGMKTLVRPIKKKLIIEEIKKYDPKKVFQSADLVHQHAHFGLSLDKIIQLYITTIQKYKEGIRNEYQGRIDHTEKEKARNIKSFGIKKFGSKLNKLLGNPIASFRRKISRTI